MGEKSIGRNRRLGAQKVKEARLYSVEKEAEANRKLAASLTPALVQYSMIQKLSDKMQV
jgi:hypothetical protein